MQQYAAVSIGALRAEGELLGGSAVRLLAGDQL